MDIIDIIIKLCVAILLLVFVICLVLTIAMVIGAAIKAAREERERRARWEEQRLRGLEREARRKEGDDLDSD